MTESSLMPVIFNLGCPLETAKSQKTSREVQFCEHCLSIVSAGEKNSPMKRLLVALVIMSSFHVFLLSIPLDAGTTKKLHKSEVPADVMDFLSSKYGKNLREVTLASDNLFRKYLDQYDVYNVNVWNPQTVIAGRPTFYYTLIIDRIGLKTILENEIFTAIFISTNVKWMPSEATAVEMAQLFSLLARVPIVSTPPNYLKPDVAKQYNIGPPSVKKDENQYLVSFFAVTDPGIGAISRITIAIDMSCVFRIVDTQDVVRLGGYD